MTFGLLEKADVMPDALAGIKLALPGEHNIYNALAAIAVAKILRVDRQAIKRGLERARPAAHRMQTIILSDKTRIIDDCYNASPRSVTAALKVLASMKEGRWTRDEGRTIAVLGDMLELGRHAKTAHRRVVVLARQLKIDKLFTFGRNWPRSAAPEKNRQQLIKRLRIFIRPRDIILVKGSRGMRLEAVVESLSQSTRPNL